MPVHLPADALFVEPAAYERRLDHRVFAADFYRHDRTRTVRAQREHARRYGRAVDHDHFAAFFDI